MTATARRSSGIRYVLGSLLTFGALNAAYGGYYGLSGAKGVPLEWLSGSPFRDYFIPSLILLVVVGGSFLSRATLIPHFEARRVIIIPQYRATIIPHFLKSRAIIIPHF